MKNLGEFVSCLLAYEDCLTSCLWKDEPSVYVGRIRDLLGKHFDSISPAAYGHIRAILGLYASYIDDSTYYSPLNDPLVINLNFQNATLKEIDSLLIELRRDINESDYLQLRHTLPESILPEDVTSIINLTYNEIITDYTNACFISAIALCGKVLETVLTALFIKVFNRNPDDEKLGFNAMVNRLKGAGYDFHSATLDQMSVIAAHRNKAIHGSIVIPTQDEARGVISLTKDVLNKTASK